ncbi:MAG: hypothetical protein ABW040_10305 [Microbacteriaceae bacterium]
MLVAAGVVTVVSFGLVGCATSLPDPTPPEPSPDENRLAYDDWFTEMRRPFQNDGTLVLGAGGELDGSTGSVTFGGPIVGEHIAHLSCEGVSTVSFTLTHGDLGDSDVQLLSEMVTCGASPGVPITLDDEAGSGVFQASAEGESGGYWAIHLVTPTDG